jgi:hypothetical protein
VRTLRQVLPKVLPTASLALILGSATTAGHPALGAPTSDEIIYQSSGVKIYRAVSRRGTPVMVLTNLDGEGNRFPSPGGAGGDMAGTERQAPPCGAEDPARKASGSPDGNRVSGTPAGPPSGSVKVVVNQGDGAAQVDKRDVEVTADGSGGTTVIININPPASPEKEAVIVPAPLAYPVVAIGGLAGAYRYPDHLHFLGYGHDTSSPSWFGGLGLNAGNGFGLKSGTPCERGFDCMFGPPSAHP